MGARPTYKFTVYFFSAHDLFLCIFEKNMWTKHERTRESTKKHCHISAPTSATFNANPLILWHTTMLTSHLLLDMNLVCNSSRSHFFRLFLDKNWFIFPSFARTSNAQPEWVVFSSSHCNVTVQHVTQKHQSAIHFGIFHVRACAFEGMGFFWPFSSVFLLSISIGNCFFHCDESSLLPFWFAGRFHCANLHIKNFIRILDRKQLLLSGQIKKSVRAKIAKNNHFHTVRGIHMIPSCLMDVRYMLVPVLIPLASDSMRISWLRMELSHTFVFFIALRPLLGHENCFGPRWNIKCHRHLLRGFEICFLQRKRVKQRYAPCR